MEHEKKEMPAKDSSKKKQSKKKKMSNSQLFIFGIVGAVAVLLIGGYAITANAVSNVSQNSAVLKMAKIFAIPAVTVNDEKVLYIDYLRDVNALTSFYNSVSEEAIPITSEQISDQVLVRLTANTVLADLARELDVTLTEEDLAPQRAQVMSEFPSEEEAAKQIEELYGWTLDEFVENIVVPLTLEQKLETVFMDEDRDIDEKYFAEEVQARHILFQSEIETDDEGIIISEESDEDLKARAQVVLDRIKGGEDFEVLAKEFGTDATSDLGGDLGFFGRDVMVPDFEKVAFSLDEGQLSDELLKTQFGYHIIRVDAKKSERNFGKFVNDHLAEAKIDLKLNIHDPFEGAGEVQ